MLYKNYVLIHNSYTYEMFLHLPHVRFLYVLSFSYDMSVYN